MFSGLRTNSIFYVLEKGEEPTLKIGQVVSVSNPQPKFPTYQPGQFTTQPMETVVDAKQSSSNCLQTDRLPTQAMW